ncbi:EAL domain-containing protein [Paenibacillus sp. SCIV0701]|uniref:EAL domain-containing protein n=1 Tax=Paenibacillus soyae TaxID=2969249 RepID=A0A9X2MSM0_9BACL|nr:EAL domain-containing protein [Paenibacillus soyae]
MRGVKYVLDMAVLLILFTAFGWELFMETRFDQHSISGMGLSLFYPIIDFVIFCGLLIHVRIDRYLFQSYALAALTFGLILLWAGDLLYMESLIQDTYKIGSWLDAWYSVGLLALAVAGIFSLGPNNRRAGDSPDQPRSSSIAALFIPYGALTAIAVFLSFHYKDIAEHTELMFAGIAITAITVLRQIMVSAEHDKLIRESKKLLEQTEYLAHHDMLTGLANRRLFERMLENCQNGEAPLVNGYLVTVFLIDLDRFQHINDTYGHDIGDRIIETVAKRLRNQFPAQASIARLGGDEFAVLLHTPPAINILSLARSCSARLSEPYLLGHLELRLTASLGITITSDGTGCKTDVLKQADMALKRAKSFVREKYCFYEEEMSLELERRALMEQSLHQALERDELLLHYQPQICAQSQGLVGVEALLRWKQEDGRFVSPAEFIPLAEESGLIVPIGEWVLREACAQAVEWDRAGLPPIQMGVNVSPRQVEAPDFVEMVLRIVESTGISPSKLVIEITESLALREEEQTIEKLKTLQARGIQVSMDDFGTGYSSLGALRSYQVDSIKIAQTFIRNIDGIGEGMTIVKAMLAMAKSMDMHVIAEGIETREQFELLRDEGCDFIQGYYFDKPMAAEDLIAKYGNNEIAGSASA